ncbi:MAG: tripartite tricarboxylate transporter substrate binding protein [Candidatus Latescibacterota bacterium]
MKILKIIGVILVLAIGWIISPNAQAQAPMGQAQSGATRDEYPIKPVRIVVGFTAGGPSDILARLVAQKLGESLGHRFIVDNRPGASGMIGAEMVAKAPPDGYTLLVVPATHSVNPSLYKKMQFNTERDFTAVGLVAEGPFVLVVHPSLPVKSVKDLIALAKSKPGQLNYASAGVGGLPHLAGELFKSMTGVQMTHIPYKGAAPATVELVGGHVPLMFNNMLSAVPHIKAGRLRALAVTTSKRSSALPEVPTVAETGVEGYDVSGWYGVLAPAGLAPDVLGRLNHAINRAVHQPDVVKQLASEGIDAVTSTPDEFTARIRNEIAKWNV